MKNPRRFLLRHLRCEERVEHAEIRATGSGSTIETIVVTSHFGKHQRSLKRPFGTSRKESAMTYISNVFVIHTTAGSSDAETDADFELIVRSPGGYEARVAFEGNKHIDEREQHTTNEY